MPCELHSAEREPSLGMRRALNTCSGIVVEADERSVPLIHFVRILTELGMIRHVKGVTGCGLEPLLAVPRHVLDGGQRAIGEEQEILEPVAHEDIVGPVDYTRERPETTWN